MRQAPQDKKLVLVLATSTLVIDTNRKAQKMRVLDRVSYIYYPVQFEKDKNKDVLVLLDSRNKINVMILVYMA